MESIIISFCTSAARTHSFGIVMLHTILSMTGCYVMMILLVVIIGCHVMLIFHGGPLLLVNVDLYNNVGNKLRCR